ncbi:uncharacterized protein [Palaemon carinicauda]|uniref:uncharacterized protein isoform X3 n=1 Tax=Palaemon carinicauda TaxID=392227 RepID=UPI0035B595FA
MRANAYYIGHGTSRLSSQTSFVNGASYNSCNDPKKSGNIIQNDDGNPAHEGHRKSFGLPASLNKSSEKNKCQEENSTLAVIQGMINVIVNTGSSLAKSIKSGIVAGGEKQSSQGNQASRLDAKNNFDKENIIPNILPYSYKGSNKFQKCFIKKQDRLADSDPSFKQGTSTPFSTKRHSNMLKSRRSTKRIRCDPKYTFRISDLSRRSSTWKNMVERKPFSLGIGQPVSCIEKSESRTGISYASQHHMEWFLQLIEDPILNSFLEADVCYRYADNYLLAMVFAYFVRSQFTRQEYTKENFFAALYLAHDMEEDDEELKYEVFPWALGRRWRCRYSHIIQRRDAIFWKINCRAVVSKKCCNQVMDMAPDHRLWTRVRPDYHGGAKREYLRHPDDNGYPRGPFKSPLQCQQCLERTCLESSNSYILYVSESESSFEEGLHIIQLIFNSDTSIDNLHFFFTLIFLSYLVVIHAGFIDVNMYGNLFGRINKRF